MAIPSSRATADKLRHLLTDTVTLNLLQPPLVVASDGYTYNIDSLRAMMKSAFWKTSPRTGEVLRPLAYTAPDSEDLMRDVSDAVAQGSNELTLTPARSKRAQAELIYDIASQPCMLSDKDFLTDRNACTLIISLNLQQSAVHEQVVRLITRCNLHDVDVLRIKVCMYCRTSALPRIMTPTPECCVGLDVAELAKCAGIWKMFDNCSYLATCPLINADKRIHGQTLENLYWSA